MNNFTRSVLAACVMAGLASVVMAQEAVIRKNMAERLPSFPKIDEVSITPIAGIYELRVGTDILYTDERGDHLIQGALIDTRRGLNLTEARVQKLTAIDFASLPLKDAIVFKQGTGARKLVVFADPNCGFCKKFERDLAQVKDITVYTFLYPILGGDSPEKSRNIWCAKDNTAAWRDWIVSNITPAQAAPDCDGSVLQRNLGLGKKYRITGTPALVFEDGKRVAGAVPPAEIETQLVASQAKR